MGKNLTTNDEYTILEGSWKLEQKPKNTKYLKKKNQNFKYFWGKQEGKKNEKTYSIVK